jgi:hypothetical protein
MQHFEWEAEPTGNNSANTGATLNLLFGQQNGQPGETGVKISDAGIFSFAAGQTFPGTGTVTSVALSAPSADFKVSGSPVTGNGTLGLAWNLSPTDANTANAIVKRDANGSFSAGAITSNLGLTAISSKSNALYAESSLVGVVGKSTGNHYGVWGESSGTATDADGIHAVSDGSEGYGLSAVNLSDGGTAMSAHGGSGPGSSFGGVGLESQGGDEANGFGGVGVIGYGGNGGAGGGWGAEFLGGSGNGHDAGIGVYAQAGSGNNPVAGEFAGDVEVLGHLSKASGSFKIDHPLDPANKYLYHSFVESPDMMNIYNGLASLDSEGEAWITLPGYFEALNQDFRYQLTAIGAPGPNLYIAQEISSNRFKIAGGSPGAKVSWQVTGIRHDAWANAHRMLVEPEKPEYEKGFYLHPELFGAPPDKGLHRSHDPQAMKLMNARQRLRK